MWNGTENMYLKLKHKQADHNFNAMLVFYSAVIDDASNGNGTEVRMKAGIVLWKTYCELRRLVLLPDRERKDGRIRPNPAGIYNA